MISRIARAELREAMVTRFFHNGLTGSAWGYRALYAASPLSTLESDLGKQDPSGFTADEVMAASKRWRSAETKQGRIRMMATMGYTMQEIIGEPPRLLVALDKARPPTFQTGKPGVQIAAYFECVKFPGGFKYHKAKLQAMAFNGNRARPDQQDGDEGYIIPEPTDKFPCHLSPSVGIKFADVPNGLAVIAKVLALGGVQIATVLTGFAWDD